MIELKQQLQTIDLDARRSPADVNTDVARLIEAAGYMIATADYARPWGGFTQLVASDADRFVGEFFPGLSPEEARLGNNESPLSPKILVVAPKQRLSWQYHDRRAERWTYLTEGGYFKSRTDEEGELHKATPGEVIQFAQSERHRLVGSDDHYTLVAEIWQHTDPSHLSDEDDIIRLADDYRR